MMEDKNTLEKLRQMDSLFDNDNATVRDLLEQALVAAAVAQDDDAENYLKDAGMLEQMYHELLRLRRQLEGLQSPQTGTYWTDSTQGVGTKWQDKSYLDPARNYPYGYAWNSVAQKVTKITTGT